MLKKTHKTRGISLVEVMMSVLLGTILFGIVFSIWYFSYKNWTLDRVRTTMRVDMEIAVERIKEELRLSSTTYLSLLKPSGETEYTAISFPAVTPDVNGFFPLDASDLIEWDRSIIYHAYDNPVSGFKELRKTEFSNNNSVLINQTQRETQLANAVSAGDGSGGPNAVNAVTKTIIERISAFTVDPKAQEFDGYSLSIRRSDNVTFGSIALAPGNHDFSFEVTEKNDDSSGYKLGVDTFSVNPSGCLQEMEVYTPQSSSGDTNSKVGPNVMWSGNNFIEYDSDSIGDYVTFRIYYDTWLDANFNNSARNNTVLTGDDLYIKLPDFDEGSDAVWQAEVEAGSASGDAVKSDFSTDLTGVTIRNLVLGGNIDSDGDTVRIKFDSHSVQALTIVEAYLDERQADEDAVNPPVINTPGTTRTQLYFTDATGGIAPGITIAAGGEVYSNWVIFPIETAKNYFVTFLLGAGSTSYWAGTDPVSINSYLMGPDTMGGNYVSQASWSVPALHDNANLPPDDTCYSTANIYTTASIEVWSDNGSVTTEIYDTKLSSPSYISTVWDSSATGVSVSGRSSSDPLMSGALWTAGSVSGTGRYAQVMADLATTPYWTCMDHSAINVTDAEYKNSSIENCSICGKYLIPGVDEPWLDNIKVTWQPPATIICDMSGYFAQDADYGIIKLLVDGQELMKGIEFNITTLGDVQGDPITSALTAEVEPRNTGK